MLIRTIITFLSFIVFSFPNVAKASCTFKTSNFIDELKNPKSINSIKIEIPKSAKFSKNFRKIAVSGTENIPDKLKKKFKAIVKVKYDFGTCIYNGSVKQNGDWKDHIALIDGKELRSLNVKLKDGNIQNAVKFKLLLPKTRNYYHEILGAIILRELGIIAPETFEVLTNINGVSSIMLFQEDSKKEMLERNKRREGPIFEGDESLTWSETGRERQFDNIMMSRMSNPNWFLLGDSSASITLNAYNKLQQAHTKQTHSESTFSLFPNQKRTKTFQNYLFLMLAMNGTHSLFPHNRKYYYNVFEKIFEPIYYDGDLSLDSKLLSSQKIEQALNIGFSKIYIFPHIAQIKSNTFSKKINLQMQQRIINNTNNLQDFIKQSLKQLLINSIYLQDRISNRIYNKVVVTPNEIILNNYKKKVFGHGIIQKNIELKDREGQFYLASIDNKKLVKLTEKDIAKIISNNTFDGERHILLPHQLPLKIKGKKLKRYFLDKEFGGELISDSKIYFDVDKNKKIFTITQIEPTDWVLFSGVNLVDWTINFIGIKNNLVLKANAQRFNYNGMTGCLNFYNSTFENTSISTNDGRCEDSINIINSSGKISVINVKNSFSDAIDFDFSKLHIKEAFISNAGNDCLDVSAGSYGIDIAYLKNCSDKGISIGEMSKFNGGKISVSQSNIAISSKDLSKVIISDLETNDVLVCVEALQKKQEFGGSTISINKSSCKGVNKNDDHSTIYEGEF